MTFARKRDIVLFGKPALEYISVGIFAVAHSTLIGRELI